VIVVTPEEAARQRALARAFADLTEQQQVAVRLRYAERRAMPDVAVALGVSVSMAERLLAETLRLLYRYARSLH
jgi:DNA-directed RNA polymerase specialized sigma24 family protein